MRSNEFVDIDDIPEFSEESNDMIEERYELTPKGFLSNLLGLENTNFLIDELKKYMDKQDYNCIVFEGSNTGFVKVEREWDGEAN